MPTVKMDLPEPWSPWRQRREGQAGRGRGAEMPVRPFQSLKHLCVLSLFGNLLNQQNHIMVLR